MRPTEVQAVHAGSLLVLSRHLERRGLELTAWWRELGLEGPQNLDPDGHIPITTMLAAWRGALRLTGSPTLALEVGADHVCMAHGMLGHLVAHSETLGGALRSLCRYFVFVSGGMSLELKTADGISRLTACNPEPDPELWPIVAQRTLAAVVTLAGGETGGAFRLQRVEWSQPAPARPEAFEAFFGAPCRFGARACQLVFESRMLELRLLHRNPELRSFFEQRLEERTASLLAPASVRDRLRAELPRWIDRGEFSAPEVARALHLSLRSLHRALAAEGTTFQRELDHVRRERCLWLMNHSEQPLEHIAFVCGFSDASGFYRAFRRWTGGAPGEFRAQRG